MPAVDFLLKPSFGHIFNKKTVCTSAYFWLVFQKRGDADLHTRPRKVLKILGKYDLMIFDNSMHGCITTTNNNFAKRRKFMARITITIPDNLQSQIVKMAGKENESISYTTTKLIDIGLMVMKKGESKKQDNNIEEYCQKLIIQINELIKTIATDKLNIDKESMSRIANETIVKFNKIKGVDSSL